MTADGTVTIDGVKMSIGAAELVEWCGVNVAADVARVRAGLTADDLMIECMDGALEEYRAEWQDYVDSVMVEADDS